MFVFLCSTCCRKTLALLSAVLAWDSPTSVNCSLFLGAPMILVLAPYLSLVIVLAIFREFVQLYVTMKLTIHV